MGPTVFLVTFASAFFWVGLRASQSLAVNHKHYALIPFVGLPLAIAEVSVVSEMAKGGVGWVVIPVWLGASGGCLSSMALHSWALKRRRRPDK